MRAVTYKIGGCDWNAWPYAQEHKQPITNQGGER